MACFCPLKCYRSKTRSPTTGRRPIVFNLRDGLVDQPVTLACGQCVGCRLERSRQWAVRIVHEASMHADNCFITLTYEDHHTPVGNTLVVADFQKFMKRLRKRFGDGIRFFHCGEYGELRGRPHYHACVFNFDFPDKVVWKRNENGDTVYLSRILDELWGRGFCSVGDVSFQSAAYVARYIMKKQTGDEAFVHYETFDDVTGEIFYRQPEYVTMSRRPGIGKGWIDKFGPDVFPHDYVVVNGAKSRPPRFYDAQYEIDNPRGFQRLKAVRAAKAKKHVENNTDGRLLVRQEVQQARIKRLKRKVE